MFLRLGLLLVVCYSYTIQGLPITGENGLPTQQRAGRSFFKEGNLRNLYEKCRVEKLGFPVKQEFEAWSIQEESISCPNNTFLRGMTAPGNNSMLLNCTDLKNNTSQVTVATQRKWTSREYHPSLPPSCATYMLRNDTHSDIYCPNCDVAAGRYICGTSGQDLCGIAIITLAHSMEEAYSGGLKFHIREYKCCLRIPTCTPEDMWEHVITHDNRNSSTPVELTFVESVGSSNSLSTSNTDNNGKQTKNNAHVVSLGLQAGFFSSTFKVVYSYTWGTADTSEPKALADTFAETLGTSENTGFSWDKFDARIFNTQTTQTVNVTVPPFTEFTEEQVVGKCGSVKVRTNKFRSYIRRPSAEDSNAGKRDSPYSNAEETDDTTAESNSESDYSDGSFTAENEEQMQPNKKQNKIHKFSNGGAAVEESTRLVAGQVAQTMPKRSPPEQPKTTSMSKNLGRPWGGAYFDTIPPPYSDPDWNYKIVSDDSDQHFVITGTPEGGIVDVAKRFELNGTAVIRLNITMENSVREHYRVIQYTIRRTHLNLYPPKFQSMNTHVSIPEESIPSGCIFKVEAIDPDYDRKGDQGIFYFFREAADNFRITRDGCIQVTQKFDADLASGGARTVKIVVGAADLRGWYTTSKDTNLELTVTITDVNDNAPILGVSRFLWTENQPAGVIADLTATDHDGPTNGAPFTFNIDRSSALFSPIITRLFSITGSKLNALESFDREERAEYAIPITVTDSGSHPMTQKETLRVTIRDENDNRMKPLRTHGKIYLDSPVTYVSVADPDIVNTDRIFYWAQWNPNFILRAKDGQIRALPSTSPGIYSLTFLVEDTYWREQVEALVDVEIVDCGVGDCGL